MKKTNFTIFCLFLFSFIGFSQNCQRSSTDWIQKYRLQSNYVPSTSYEAVKTIPINIVIFGKDDGSKYPITPTEFATDRGYYEEWVNKAYSFTQNTVCQTICPSYLPDTKIRIVINEVYFINNTAI